MRLVSVLISLLILGLSACKNVEDPYEIELDNLYIPLEVGKYKIYQQDSIYFYLPGPADSLRVRSWLKEEVVENTMDENGQQWFVIDRYLRYDSLSNWSYKDQIRWSIQDNLIYLWENNLQFLKMVLPVESFNSWNSNSNFDSQNLALQIGNSSVRVYKDNWESRITEMNFEDTLSTSTFSDCLNIQLIDNSDYALINLRQVNEVYSKNIGLIYAKWRILDSQNYNPEQAWESSAEKGFILEQVLIEHN